MKASSSPCRTSMRSTDGNSVGTAGAESLAALLSALRDYVLEPGGKPRNELRLGTELKIVTVESAQDHVKTRMLLAVWSDGDERKRSINTQWSVTWTSPGTDSPRIAEVRLESFESVTKKRGDPWFRDVAAEVLGSDPAWKHTLLRGTDDWAERIARFPYYERLGTPGVAIADVNGDGLEDIYLAQGYGVPNLLLTARSDGTMHDGALNAGVDFLDDTRGVLLSDFDGDGAADLAAAMPGAVVFAKGDGSGGFRVSGHAVAGDDPMSIAAADYDGDGDLDLYVTAYFRTLDSGTAEEDGAASGGTAFPGGSLQFVYHDANDGGANRLLRNDGDFRFVDVTVASGLDANNRRWSFAASWNDYDLDGDQDLYVANDYGRNNLYRNDGDGFTDVAAITGTEDAASGMSVTWGDFDRDGLDDLYVSNMFSAAGRRIAHGDRFKADAGPEVRSRIRGFARGNSLLRQRGGGFDHAKIQADVENGLWAWGSLFFDANGDGWQDLFVGNGYLTTEDTGDL